MRTIGPALSMSIGPVLMALALIFTACAKSEAPTSAPAPIGLSTPASSEAPASFFLEIVTPKDESVVQESWVQVHGRTAPDAVVSVDGQPAEVDATGNFSATVTLEKGPNSIEIIASDFRGNQQSRLISLVYTG